MNNPNDAPSPPAPFGDGQHPAKGKEKKRVFFSENTTPPTADNDGGLYSGGASSDHLAPGDNHDSHEDRRPSGDGVDHHELTRALSRILSEDEADMTRAHHSRQSSDTSESYGHGHATPPSQLPLTEPSPPHFAASRQHQQEQSEKAARDRADRLAQSVERSRHGSRENSIDGDESDRLSLRARRRQGGRLGSSSDGDDNGNSNGNSNGDADNEPGVHQHHSTAYDLVQSHARGGLRPSNLVNELSQDDGFRYDASLAYSAGPSGVNTPTMLEHEGHPYVPPPAKYNGGILSSLLRLYNNQEASASNSAVNSEQTTPSVTPATSRPASPGPGIDGQEKRRSGFFGGGGGKKSGKSDPTIMSSPKSPSSWNVFHAGHKQNASRSSLSAGLLGSASMFATAGSADIGQAVTEKVIRERPGLKRNRNSASSAFGLGSPGANRRKRREEEQMRITKHIAQVLSRHRYLTTLCRALMMYGAPTHRLEDYLRMTARVLEIEAQFLYIPGCMLVSFDDSSTHTAEVKLVRAPQGVDLGKLRDVHVVYKEVIHDLISVDEAITMLNNTMKRKIKYGTWVRVPAYGLASVCVAPFAFGGRFIDLPVAFFLGCLVGLLALIAAPSNAMYSNVFEISAAVATSFLARAFGSIAGGKVFCFSALAQSSIALILPGYMVLCSSLELQSQNIVAGSVRMVYAMIYTLFLGYGITIGSAVYGAIDSNAVSTVNCSNSLSRPWYFLFVPLFTICLCVINQAKYKQMPTMVIISVAGFAVNTYASSYFSSNAQIASTLGALTVGVLANIYARTSRYYDTILAWVHAHVTGPCSAFYIRRRRRWTGLHSSASSRRLSPESGGKEGEYFDMPSYGNDPQSRAEAGDSRPVKAAEAAAERKAPGSTEVMGYGLAAAAMLPAIFVQVPSGLAVNGSLLAGINTANELTGNKTAAAATSSDGSSVNNVAFTVLLSVIQVAIGITVGLFLSALLVYPFGKRRSALFSF